MYSEILEDEEQAIDETDRYSWTLDERDCGVLKLIVQNKNNSAEEDERDFGVNSDANVDVEQLLPRQDEPQVTENDEEERSFKSAITAAEKLEYPLVPMMTAERVRRISLKTYCLVVIDDIWTLVYLYAAVNGVYTYCIDGVFQVGKTIRLLSEHYGRYQTTMLAVDENSAVESPLCPERWLYLKKVS